MAGLPYQGHLAALLDVLHSEEIVSEEQLIERT